jgi:hypothetical protein
MMLDWTMLHPRMNLAALGYLPDFIDAEDPRDARTQLDAGYKHFGGFSAMKGFRLDTDNWLHFPGDPPLPPIAQARLRAELICVYQGDWVAVIQPDRSFVVARMD